MILALLFALLNMAAVFLIFGAQKHSDTLGYIKAIHWFRGENVDVARQWLLRPLGSFLASPFQFFGDGAGLIVQNIIFYLLCAYLIFRITEIIFKNKKQAFFAALFFITATPVIEFGFAYLTDMGAWFFYLFSLFLTLLYLKNKDKNLIPLNGLVCGLGVLMKENGGLGVVFFAMMILLSRKFSGKEKIFKIIYFGIFFLIPIGILQVLMFRYFHFTSLDWYLINKTSLVSEGLFLTCLRYFGQLFRILGILWPFFLLGLWREWQERSWERIKIFLALVPSSFSFLLWTTGGGGRTVFIFAPLGILLASRGLIFFDKKLQKPILIGLFLTLIVCHYYFVWINPQIAFVDRIAEFLGIL